jgi:large subunit ribosomal protein L40e
MDIFIKTLKGRSNSCINIELSDTVYNMKKKIEERFSVSISFQVLIFAGKVLEDYKSLEEYGLYNEACLFLHITS